MNKSLNLIFVFVNIKIAKNIKIAVNIFSSCANVKGKCSFMF